MLTSRAADRGVQLFSMDSKLEPGIEGRSLQGGTDSEKGRNGSVKS